MKPIGEKLLGIFREEHHEHAEQIRLLIDRIRQAESPGQDLDEAFRRAHSLKGAARAVDIGAQLVWISPPSNQHDFIEVWRATTNDRTGAVLAFRGKASNFFDSSSTVVTRYFWIRAGRESGGYSAWHPVSSTGGVSVRYGGAARPRNMLVVESWTAGDVPGSVGNFVANESASRGADFA